ncbi:MAG: 1-(5-phosphoribosyl)-5-[(5-phosphoribosylamino)methylideneamino]imidazole-4-carboxamide isomerase [Deltaproteobacteria bacterium GWC2_42_51]|nr:MAG: 1-(5-phosphoribosyl)-5-[(5-phosphoribosylamino)methylideneamino]imidazole-4-carboxamide isomerase [Deltaproteobacteria bacterium GWB2_42_7]OGP31352.1 MAG: 1-(5-phosphoribosyl)-5-[(5-phosphoribosylamino)methylideneamino]imidazole-4-carboxamide isomerase [Deltaproteobacteria bacterium GWC2_42_51]OGP38189.1 MAG: 1-(5-phosphoribosyl)-5-[(5-phosphoribosylamino)methylideneamino]imidazole-4-carboxamide isomerase [Deltaproteobacteria bacterium GWD2_42_10]OGP47484.1 MAG: 1-(5-phosphoribosyl)-5-[(
MLIIPAIDIKDGKCVRLTQGRMDAETVYSENPVEISKKWEEAGAKLIHIVDLDGAIKGIPKNQDTIKKIIQSIKTPVEIGGGIRDLETIKNYLGSQGVKRVIIGTVAQENPQIVEKACKMFPEGIAVGIDAKDGMVATRGWVKVTSEKATDLAKRLESLGITCIIYTDIARDGMLTGPNVKATKEMAHAVNIPVIASGGMSSVKDIEGFKGLKLEGIIIGKALYTGAINLREAIEVAESL